MTVDRRGLLVGAGAGLISTVAVGEAEATSPTRRFPRGFLWGASTSGHQTEGNNLNSDVWLLENVTPTVFREPSRDAVNSFELWRTDLDLVRQLGLNTYRFSIEWARIEPEQGLFSRAMLDHYKAMIAGCRARGLNPVVSFNHGAAPRWFSARGGWYAADAADLFATYCGHAARHLAADIAYACTLNEPNSSLMMMATPPELVARVTPLLRAMNAAAGRACGAEATFYNGLIPYRDDVPRVQEHLLAAHARGRAAIKAVRPDLPVGVTLAIRDEQDADPAAGGVAASRRQSFYGPWLEAVRGDDFVGVQNYARARWQGDTQLPPPEGARLSPDGEEVYPRSLANVVRHAYAMANVPVLVTEHGVGTDDDSLRAWLIPQALAELHTAISEGVPVIGYLHWSLLDNFEWIHGFRVRYGLCEVNRSTFERAPKSSALIYRDIARRNALRLG